MKYKEFLASLQEDERMARADYKVGPSGRKSHKQIVFRDGERDDEEDEKKEVKESVDDMISEVLSKDASAGEWIQDFINSDNPKFAGKSKEKRKQMALAAYYAKQRNEEVELEEARYGRHDAYTRDYHSSISGMGKHQSAAYHADGGANDEGWDDHKPSYHKPADHPHSVHINGKKWKTFGSQSHATNVARKIKGATVHKEEVELEETVKLGSKVRIHAPGKDYHDQVGHVGEIRHGAYKGAPKTYTVDYGDRKSVQLDKKNVKLHKEETELDEATTPYYKKPSWIKKMSQAAKQERLAREKKEAEQKQVKESSEGYEMNENAPVAPTLVKHRIGVTVSDPNATAASQRKEKIQKFVRVTHSDNKEGAKRVGEKHFKKKGYIVHDSWHAGMVNEEVLDEKVDKKAELRDALNRHTEKAIEANRRGDDEAVKVHQGYINKIKTKMANLVRNEEVVINEGDHDPFYDAQENKKSAEAARKQGDHFAYHMHMADHHSNMAHWSSNRGRYHVADQHQAKADEHHDYAMQHKAGLRKEEVELDESMEDSWKKIQQMDKGSVLSGKEGAQKRLAYLNAVHAHHKKFGNDTKKVKSDIEAINRSGIAEETDTVKRDKDGKVISWKHEGDWKKNDPKKNPEGKVHNLTGQALKKTKELTKEETMAKTYKQFMEEIVESLELEEGYIVKYHAADGEHKNSSKVFADKAKAQAHADKGNSINKVGGKYTVHKIDAEGRTVKEETELDEGQIVKTATGYRHIGTYGTAKGAKYGNTDYDTEKMDKDDDEDSKEAPAKRGRGRPAGAKSGANQKVTSGKSYGGINTHSLHLPNTNR